MFIALEAYTDQGDRLELPLGDASSGLEVRDITGLEPPNASITSTRLALQDGVQIEASRREPRSIGLKLGMIAQADKSVMQIRKTLYGWFMTKASVRLRFIFDGFPTVDIQGLVEDFNAPLFVKDPEATISIFCASPVFFTPDTVVVNGFSTAGQDSMNVTYPGTVETGFTFKLFPDRVISRFSLSRNLSNGEGGVLDFSGATLNPGDILELNTQDGEKGVWRIRDGVRQSILYAVSSNSDWVDLMPGNNAMRLYIEGATIPYTMEYRTKLGGL